MLEEKEGGFSREIVVASVQKQFEYSVYKQLRRSKPKPAEIQAFVVTGRGKNRRGRGGSRHSSKKPGGSQGGRRNGGSGRGHGNGGSDGGGFSGGGASSGRSSAATVNPGGRTCCVCKSDQYYVREYPKQIFQGCGEGGYLITKCGKTENAVMAVDVLGRTTTDDDYPVCSEAEVEAYTTLEIKTGECLASMMEEGEIRQMRGDLWIHDTGSTGHFTYDSRLLEN